MTKKEKLIMQLSGKIQESLKPYERLNGIEFISDNEVTYSIVLNFGKQYAINSKVKKINDILQGGLND